MEERCIDCESASLSRLQERQVKKNGGRGGGQTRVLFTQPEMIGKPRQSGYSQSLLEEYFEKQV